MEEICPPKKGEIFSICDLSVGKRMLFVFDKNITINYKIFLDFAQKYGKIKKRIFCPCGRILLLRGLWG